MDTKKLRQKILDLAIRGKLVPQDPNDEPASVLLERIRAEKERLIKEGKIKRSKKSASDTPHYENEVPFEVPESWEWTTIEDVTVNRDSERIPLSLAVRKKQQNKIYDYYGAAGVIDKVENYLFDERLLLVGEDGANLLSRSKDNAFFAEGKYWVNNHAHVLDCPEKSVLDYVAFVINSMSLENYITGSAQPKLTQDNLNKILIPLPPEKEQHRIIESVNDYFSFISLLEGEIGEMNSFVQKAKSKILDLAIHGKLVPQDPNDEPAIGLLKRINPKFTPCDNAHYENNTIKTPENWEWVKLSDIAVTELGKTLDKGKNSGTPHNYLCAFNVKWCSFDLSVIKKILLEDEELERYRVRKGDLLICEGGDVGRAAIWESDQDIYYQNALHRVRFKDEINQHFYLYVLQYYKSLGMIDDVSSGVTIKHFTQNSMKKLSFPLPPIKEQYRIVSAINQYNTLLDNISANL